MHLDQSQPVSNNKRQKEQVISTRAHCSVMHRNITEDKAASFVPDYHHARNPVFMANTATESNGGGVAIHTKCQTKDETLLA